MLKRYISTFILVFCFINVANSQIKIGKPPGGGKGGDFFKVEIRHFGIHKKIGKFVKQIHKNAKVNNIEFPNNEFMSVSNVFYYENLFIGNLNDCDPTSEGQNVKEISTRTKLLISGKAMDILKEIINDERLFVDYLISTYGVTNDQAIDTLNLYKIIVSLST